MNPTSTTRRSTVALIAILAGLTFTLAACRGGAPSSQDGSMDQQRTQEFNQLMQRPDIDQIVAKYNDMFVAIRRQLSAKYPSLKWKEDNPPTAAACDEQYNALNQGAEDDAETKTLGNWYANGTIGDADWPHVLSIVSGIVGKYGVNGKPKVMNNKPGVHDVVFFDPYQAQLSFGTGTDEYGSYGVAMTMDTGCHLTAAAKKRGHPAPNGPTDTSNTTTTTAAAKPEPTTPPIAQPVAATQTTPKRRRSPVEDEDDYSGFTWTQ